MQPAHATPNPKREITITRLSIAATSLLFAAMFGFIFHEGWLAYGAKDFRHAGEALLFGGAMFFMAYGNLLYQICLAGYYKRKQAHAPAEHQELYRMYNRKAPSLTVLVPSYKEERLVVWQTMVSAALAEYPHKNVVLLIDDPCNPRTQEDADMLEQARRLPDDLQKMFNDACAPYREELEAFRARKDQLRFPVELTRLSVLYEEAAEWLENLSFEFSEGKALKELGFAKRFFARDVLLAPAEAHRKLAQELRHKMVTLKADGATDAEFLESHYARLAGLFHVTFSSFERKKYRNLSHEANKAMNLNSYIALIGKSWKEVKVTGGMELREAFPDEADFTVPPADYIDTLDADTVMLGEYALRLIHLMEQKGNERLAVIQSPCSTLPGCDNPIERVAGACIDIQFLTHQGYSHWNATSWVGANAMLRTRALEEIKEMREENGKQVAIYIQDRTVIEDTESTIDLVEKGWKLYNYPERMTFSPTPPDFGSLLIQRRRWSNGGMIILPKLFSYARKSPKNFALLKEMFMRFHYLSSTTTVCMSALLLFCYPFGEVSSSLLIPLSAVPCLLLYARDLKLSGYKYSDVLRIWALTLMLFPIMIGGVFKQFEQMATGRKIPFGRTPKVPGRTAAPALYCLIELALTLFCCGMVADDVWQHHWVKAIFSGMNAGFMAYALVVFMGVRETLEDIAAGANMYAGMITDGIEKTLLPAMRRGAYALLMPLRREV